MVGHRIVAFRGVGTGSFVQWFARSGQGVVRAVVYPRITANIGRTNNVRLYKFLTSSDDINYVWCGQWVSLSR